MTADDTRTRILNAAGPIFAEKGYEAATVREICHEATVNLASVNYYFGGKERLYLEVMRLAHSARFGPTLRRQWPADTPPQSKLREFIHGMLTRLLGPEITPWQEQLMVREIMNPTPIGRELLREHLQNRFGQLQEILDEILPADTPSYKRHQIGFTIIGQCVFYRSGRNIVPLLVGEEELSACYGIEQLAEHISQVSLAALGLGPPLAPRHSAESHAEDGSPGAEEHFAVPADQAGKPVS